MSIINAKIKSSCVAITGTIASGKSTVLSLLSKSYKVFSSDLYVHQLSQIKQDGYLALAKHPQLKNYICFESKQILRSKLRQDIFNDHHLKTQLENIFHPLVKKCFDQDVERILNDSNVFFYEIPLLFQLGLENNFHRVINIICDKKHAISRLISRDQLTLQSAQDQFSALYYSKVDSNKKNGVGFKELDKDSANANTLKLSDQAYRCGNIYYLYNNYSLQDLKLNLQKIIDDLQK